MNQKYILVTGYNVDTRYNRSLIILNGFKKIGYEVTEFPFNKFNKSTARKIKELSNNAQFILVPSFGHKSVNFVKRNSSCDVVFDPLISKYMTNIHDYKSHHKFSYEALRSWYRDKVSINKADFVIFDTSEHRRYFSEKYGIAKKRTGIVYVGSNSRDFKRETPGIEKSPEIFRIGFIGHFIPLQGILKILEVARQLKKEKDIEFYIIGQGYQYEEAKNYAEDYQLEQVIFKGQVDYKRLDSYINSFDLCLGIFGDTFKARVVIPNKIFNYASCGRPVLTMDSDAIREVFTHNKNIYLCEARPEEMVRSIRFLKENLGLRKKLGDNIYELISKNYNEEKTAASLLSQYEDFKRNQIRSY
ncbi:glycosyltransferase [Salinimicrobium terrae]|uniref:glycosyltransferase n=1 Tax=Salinimicrobium terrae TaxID=470866 RepID=UPI000429BC77|nr:glycosyltransferase [Salinimicrobium terrae]